MTEGWSQCAYVGGTTVSPRGQPPGPHTLGVLALLTDPHCSLTGLLCDQGRPRP